MKQIPTDVKEEKDDSTLIAKDFNASFSTMVTICQQQIVRKYRTKINEKLSMPLSLTRSHKERAFHP